MVQLMFWCMLDVDPGASSEKLASLMALLRQRYPNNTKITKNVLGRNLLTLGVWMWLDDEVVNHLVKKWCTQSLTTLGMSSFFAVRFLFQEEACNIACDIGQVGTNIQL
ncbi:hypothetical protein GYMLUDRAFT_64038 [Collybiopsis luxurians FD-317 M1]|uniref:Uncharacterized protein n=1 Tax=Collybiopsis luxurians FD-317 M1 TaxID=944289 RepID=A0A0D0BT29_9AGAR|nr:hypothetical protein GYMLUDRAFT_64038 [Collybiopsis luxurians FD-317 M1]